MGFEHIRQLRSSVAFRGLSSSSAWPCQRPFLGILVSSFGLFHITRRKQPDITPTLLPVHFFGFAPELRDSGWGQVTVTGVETLLGPGVHRKRLALRIDSLGSSTMNLEMDDMTRLIGS